MIRLEHAALVALAVVLPVLEAPKNLLWLLYLALWLANRARARDFGGPWDRWDTLIVLWIASAQAAVVFAGLGAEWRAGFDVLRYTTVLWAMKRSRYPESVLAALLVALAAGTLLALGWGYYRIFLTTQHEYLGLKSVGHVNHSAIYLAIAFGATLIATRAWWRHAAAPWSVGGLLCTLLFAVSLFVMQSRAAVGAAIVVAVVLLLAYAVRHRHGMRRLALGAAIAVGIGLAVKPKVLEKNYVQIEASGTLLAFREGIWHAGLLAWREFPVFGVGTHSWGRISETQLESAAAQRGETLDSRGLVFSSHGHSLYLNTLVERGVLGLAAVLAVLIAWAVALFRHIPDAAASALRWSYWGGSAAAWMVAVIVGLVNTTLHHEHALLSMLLLGAWLAHERTTRGRAG
ncbi:MAG TPA: O-antigen ligase family protein [Burkholderiales bacterium]|nr:O-antigen ligase family protein [Burkholderiales bacterium]